MTNTVHNVSKETNGLCLLDAFLFLIPRRKVEELLINAFPKNRGGVYTSQESEVQLTLQPPQMSPRDKTTFLRNYFYGCPGF